MYRHSNIISNSPINFALDDGIELGKSTTGRDIFLKADRLHRHLIVMGKTGSGKSNFLKVLIKGIITRNEGSVFLFDPHGNLGKEVVSMFPDKSAIISPVGLNKENCKVAIKLNSISVDSTLESSNIAAGWIKDAFANEGVFSHGTWGPRLEVIFTSILGELMRKNPQSTLGDLLNLLLDGSSIRKFISCTENLELKSFLKMQIADWRGWNQYVTSSINKLLPLLTDPGIKNLISGSQDSFRLLDLFTGRSSVIIPEIWRDVVPDDSFKIIGMLLLLKLWLQRMRSYNPDTDKPIYMIFDEAQLVPGNILDRLLREGRKFGFRVIMATQFLGRGLNSLSETIRGNVGNVVSFNVFEDDAKEISSNFFTGELDHKLRRVLKAQSVHHAVIWSQDEQGISGPLSYTPMVVAIHEDPPLFQEIRERSLLELGTTMEEQPNEDDETDLHEFLILKFQEYLFRKGVESDRHKSFNGIYPDLYFEFNNSTIFVEVEVSDLVNIGRVTEKIINYSGKTLIFITPPGASSQLYVKILQYIENNGFKIMESLEKNQRDLLSKISILEYDNGFNFYTFEKLRKFRMEHLFQGTFTKSLTEMPFSEIRSFIYAQMIKEGVTRLEFPEEKIGKIFGTSNSQKALKKICGDSLVASISDIFGVN